MTHFFTVYNQTDYIIVLYPSACASVAETQTMSYILSTTDKVGWQFVRLHSVDDDAIQWLANLGW